MGNIKVFNGIISEDKVTRNKIKQSKSIQFSINPKIKLYKNWKWFYDCDRVTMYVERNSIWSAKHCEKLGKNEQNYGGYDK